MATSYRIDVEDTTGTAVDVIETFVSLELNLRWNDKGDFNLVISGFENEAIDNLGDDYVIRVWRNDTIAGDGWQNIFNGINKTFNDSLFRNGNKNYTIYGPDGFEILDKAYVLYPSNSSEANKSAIASTAMLELVDENVGANALATNGRDVDGTNPITNDIDPSSGAVWTENVSRQHLLTVLRQIWEFSKVNFTVEYQGNYAWLFRCGQLYKDRSIVGLDTSTGKNAAGNVPIVFSPDFNNVLSFTTSRSRYNEYNTIVSLGKGVGSKKAADVAQDATAVAVSPIAQRETVVSAQNNDSSQLSDTGTAKLQQFASEIKVSFEPKMNDIILFRDFFLGDIVSVIGRNKQVLNKQLVGISLNVNPDGEVIETINLDWEDV